MLQQKVTMMGLFITLSCTLLASILKQLMPQLGVDIDPQTFHSITYTIHVVSCTSQQGKLRNHYYY